MLQQSANKCRLNTRYLECSAVLAMTVHDALWSKVLQQDIAATHQLPPGNSVRCATDVHTSLTGLTSP